MSLQAEDLRVAEIRHLSGDTEFDEKQICDSQDFYDFIWIWDESAKRLYYGGWQKWYESNTHADFGCVPQSAANLIAMLAFRNSSLAEKIRLEKKGAFDTILKADYMELMNQMYACIGTMEIPFIRWFYDRRKRGEYKFHLKSSYGNDYKGTISGIRRYGKTLGIQFNINYKECMNVEYEDALVFIRKGLKSNGAVLLFTVKNHHNMFQYKSNTGVYGMLIERKCGMTKHAVTITGLRHNSETQMLEVVISSFGMASVIEYDSLYTSWQNKNAKKSAMMYFEVL